MKKIFKILIIIKIGYLENYHNYIFIHRKLNLNKKELNAYYDEFYNKIKNIINWNKLSKEDCIDLGFCFLDKETNILLIPLWLYPTIPIGFELYNIFNEKIINNGNLDIDNRSGYLAYGLKFER